MIFVGLFQVTHRYENFDFRVIGQISVWFVQSFFNLIFVFDSPYLKQHCNCLSSFWVSLLLIMHALSEISFPSLSFLIFKMNIPVIHASSDCVEGCMRQCMERLCFFFFSGTWEAFKKYYLWCLQKWWWSRWWFVVKPFEFSGFKEIYNQWEGPFSLESASLTFS